MKLCHYVSYESYIILHIYIHMTYTWSSLFARGFECKERFYHREKQPPHTQLLAIDQDLKKEFWELRSQVGWTLSIPDFFENLSWPSKSSMLGCKPPTLSAFHVSHDTVTPTYGCLCTPTGCSHGKVELLWWVHYCPEYWDCWWPVAICWNNDTTGSHERPPRGDKHFRLLSAKNVGWPPGRPIVP